MRKETLMVIPEIQGEKKEMFDSLIGLSQVKKQIDSVETQRSSIKNQMGRFSDDFEIMLAKVKEKGITTTIIKSLTDEEIDELLVKEDGTPITINVPMDTKKQEYAFKRDFLDMLINNDKYFAQIDASLAELDLLVVDYNKNVRQIYTEINGDISSYVRNSLEEEKAEAGENSDRAKSIQVVLNAIDSAINMNPIYDALKDLDPRNTINDFMRRSEQYGVAFNKNCKKNGLAVDVSRFPNIEGDFLTDMRHRRAANFFLFTVVKVYGKKKNFTRVDTIFLTQLVVNLQTLLFDHKRGSVLTPEQEDRRAAMIAGIERVLDIFFPVDAVVEIAPVTEAEAVEA